MPGLIEQVLSLGLERSELCKDHPGAEVGGWKIPFPPKDMASIVTILKGSRVNTCLVLGDKSAGAVRFLEAHLHIPEIIRPDKTDAKGLRKLLRTLTDPVDLIVLDGRDLPLDADTLWRYIEGGREDYPREFGKGAPLDYGVPKLRMGASIVVNLADPGCRQIWYRVRARHHQSYQSPFVGVARVAGQ